MATVYGTGGYITRSNGQTVAVILPKGVVLSARGRLRGRQSESVSYDYNVASDSGSGVPYKLTDLIAPGVPSGYSFAYHWHIASFSAGAAADYNLQNGLESKTAYGSSGSLASTNYSNSVGTSYAFVFYLASGTGSYSFQLRTYGKKTVYTQTSDPAVSIGGAGVLDHSGALNNGVETDWQNIDVERLTPDATNTFTVAVSGSGQVDVWIEVEMLLAAQAVLIEPAPFDEVTRDELSFRVSHTLDPDATAERWFPRIEADRAQNWGSPERVWDASLDRTAWHYLDGLVWRPLPAEGAPVGAQVRLHPPDAGDMATVRWYCRTRAYTDESGWGDYSDVRYFRLTLMVGPKRRATLEIDYEDWTTRVVWMRVSMATQGEKSVSEALLSIRDGDRLPGEGQTLDLAIRGTNEVVEQYSGKVSERPERVGPGLLRVRAGLGDAILVGRVVTRNTAYPMRDVGLNLRALVDDFCAPLDSSRIDPALGIERQISGYGQSAMDVFREVGPELGLLYGVDSTVSPQAVWAHFPTALLPPTTVVSRGTPQWDVLYGLDDFASRPYRTWSDNWLSTGVTGLTFARASAARTEDGTSITAGNPRYETGKFGQAIQVEEGTQNLLVNPGFETGNLGGWTDGYGTRAVSTASVRAGTYSVRLASSEARCGQIVTDATPGTVYTASAYLRKVTGTNIGLWLRFQRSDGTLIGSEYSSLHTTATWTRKTITQTAPVETARVVVDVRAPADASHESWADDIQLEAKPYATSMCPVPADSTTRFTRAPETLNMPGGRFKAEGTIECSIQLDRTPGTQNQVILDVNGPVNRSLRVYIRASDSRLVTEYGTGSAVVTLVSTSTFAAMTWYGIAVRWSAAGVKQFRNGADEGSSATAPNIGFAERVWLGSQADGTLQLDGRIDDVRVSSTAHSDAAISADYSAGTALPEVVDTTAKVSCDGTLFVSPEAVAIRSEEMVIDACRAACGARIKAASIPLLGNVRRVRWTMARTSGAETRFLFWGDANLNYYVTQTTTAATLRRWNGSAWTDLATWTTTLGLARHVWEAVIDPATRTVQVYCDRVLRLVATDPSLPVASTATPMAEVYDGTGDARGRFDDLALLGTDAGIEARLCFRGGDPTWETRGSSVTRVWAAIKDSSPTILVSAAVPGVATADHVDAPMVWVELGATEAQARALANKALEAYRDRGVNVTGTLPLTTGLVFDRLYRVQWWEGESLRTSLDLPIKKYEHLIAAKRFETTVYFGDHKRPPEDLVASLIGKLARTPHST
jgi:hypothetical protein